MCTLETATQDYLKYCRSQKRLDDKTLKAYRIDLRQFTAQIHITKIPEITSQLLEDYISTLHQSYKPKTVKRKIASLKAFFHYLEYKELLIINPFNKLQVRFREPVTLPRVIPLHTVESLLKTVYLAHANANTPHRKSTSIRDIAVLETLFATGIRIYELCSLRPADINLYEGVILIYGKGSKERKIQICDDKVIAALSRYQQVFLDPINTCGHFFVNQSGRPLSDQSVRRMINRYAKEAAIDLHITPHMFRHTFATCLLEADVDIRYIQEMLGHSSINITQIYTHVAMSKQREILALKHPRKNLHI